MHWLRAHLYLSLIALAALTLVFGALTLKKEVSSSQDGGTIAWGGMGGNFSYPLSGTANPTSTPAGDNIDLYTRVQNNPPFTYTPYTTEGTEGGGANDFDLEAFLALLSRDTETESTGIESEAAGSLLLDPYSFIPTGIFTPPNTAKERAPEQQELYEYGNTAGVFIQSFEDANRDMSEVVQRQADSPSDQVAITALLQLANELTDVGEELESIDEIAAQAESANKKLAESYKDMGAKLALVPSATTEEGRVEVMLTYNAAAEEFVEAYVTLVTLFSINDVTFSSADPGSVFTFTQTGF